MPGVIDAQVIGIPDPVFGEEVMAWVRVGDGVSLTRDDVVAYAAGNIAHFKIPRYLHVTDDFPMTVTGKIQKYKLRELSIDMLDAATTDPDGIVRVFRTRPRVTGPLPTSAG